jgi:hypothetical protein
MRTGAKRRASHASQGEGTRGGGACVGCFIVFSPVFLSVFPEWIFGASFLHLSWHLWISPSLTCI